MKPINVEITMGHDIGISAYYYKPTEREVLDDYLKSIEILTIDTDKLILQKQVEELTEKTNHDEYIIKSKLQEKDAEVQKLKEQMLFMQDSQSEILALIKDPAKLMAVLNEK